MPGSLVNLLDVHSNHSDVSAQSCDSRTSGKKVSFNKAVRVKQYPWSPDDYRENHVAVVLPSQRFWFKVYKGNPSPVPQGNRWKDGTTWTDELYDGTHDSLTPIAEDEDLTSEADTRGSHLNGAYNMMNHRQINLPDSSAFLGRQPLEPPIDYMDDKRVLMHKQYDLENNIQPPYIARARLKKHGKSNFDVTDKCNPEQPRSFSANGFSSPLQSPDICRPTISSAAKCSVDRHEPRHATSNARLSRMNYRESAINGDEWPKPQTTYNQRERRSKSSDGFSSEHNGMSSKREDKSVSTEDLPSIGTEGFSMKSQVWWNEQRTKNKSTQCSGTLTRAKKNDPSSMDAHGISKPFISPNSANNVKFHTHFNDCLRLAEKPPQMSGVSQLVNQLNQQSQHCGMPTTQGLSLSGKNCISISRQNGFEVSKDERHAITSFNSRCASDRDKHLKHNNHFVDKNEYDYVTDPVTNVNSRGICVKEQQWAPNRSMQHSGNENAMHKGFPWRPASEQNFITDSRSRQRESSPSAAVRFKENDTYDPLSVEHVRGRHILTGQTDHQITNAPKRIPSKFDFESRKSPNGLPVSESFRRPAFKSPVRQRSSSENRKSRLGYDDDQQMIDWSLSGFRFGRRPENNPSSSSDSECVVHRRPALLMYIPGISHHDRPASEDFDRLSTISGMSRSEAEDDLSPLSTGVRAEFKRRHSMPRNGKLNWLKWKTNKKAS